MNFHAKKPLNFNFVIVAPTFEFRRKNLVNILCVKKTKIEFSCKKSKIQNMIPIFGGKFKIECQIETQFFGLKIEFYPSVLNKNWVSF